MGYTWVIYGLYMGYIKPWYDHDTTMIRRMNRKNTTKNNTIGTI
jgi:hypothetical protein